MAFDTETVDGFPYTGQYSGTDGVRGIDDCHGRPELARAMVAAQLFEAKPGDFILSGFFYFRFDIQVIFRDKPELFEGLGNIDFEDEHGIHWKGSSQWPVIFLIGRYKKRTILCIDAWRFFPGSLAGVCRDLGLAFQKLETPACVKENRAPTEAERAAFDAYSLGDTDACLEILKEIDKIFELEQQGPCISVAHLSGKKFRRDHAGGVGLDVPDERGQELGLLAYKGGRNSMVADDLPLIVPNCAMYDVRSLYPYICSEILPSFFGGRWVWDMRPQLQGAGIYWLEGELLKGDCWPYRLLMDAKGDYHTPGPIKSVQTGFEIQTAIKHGLLAPGFKFSGMVWEPGRSKQHPFKTFYAEVFAAKEAQRGKNQTLYTYYKNVANCLTGKFASTIPQEVTENRVIDGRLTAQTQKIRVPGLLYNPAVGGLITGPGRCLLFECELASKSVHGATDSLVVPPWGTPPPEGPGLGQWEKAATGTFVAARNKLYAFLGPKTHGNWTGWLDKHGKPTENRLERKNPVWNGQIVDKYALHAFKGTVFQFLDAVFSGNPTYKYSRMVQLKESRKRKNLKPLQMNDFVEALKLGGKYFQPKT